MSGIESRIEAAKARLERAEKALAKAEARVDGHMPGGRTGYDSAILSGIRRKPNHKADSRRFNAYTAEANAAQEVEDARTELDRLERQRVRSELDAASRAALDLDAIKPGWAVRDDTGWHRVVRVNAKSVAVETGYSWTDRIAKSSIIEARALEGAAS